MLFLGIEIGGTKLQLGVGRGDGSPLVALERLEVDPAGGATGILRQVETRGTLLVERHGVAAIGCGFGGPVDVERGIVIKSHHVEGWDNFPLVEWLGRAFQRPARVANDADTAGLAEARFGAGKGFNPVFFVTVGTGIGGGLVVDRQIYRGHASAAAELGHLRPGLHADRPDQNLEALAAGWGIAAAAQARLAEPISHRLSPLVSGLRAMRPEAVRQRLIEMEDADEEHVADLLNRSGGAVEKLTARVVGQAAAEGNLMAQEVLTHAVQALGWGIAQVITLLAPQAVVIGGGVSLMGEQLFFVPVRAEIERYVFPPLAGTYRVLPAELGEEVVVHGAVALAATLSAAAAGEGRA